MKVAALLSLGAVLLLAGMPPAYADNGMFLNWPLIPGPSGYLGPFMPVSRPPPGRQHPIRPPVYQAPVSVQYSAHPLVAVSPGEPDETGRIGPTEPFERDADGKLLPTYTPR
jgi:hypothetical protein